jgi:pimeloyl-ACP methyl ester carboxylesterase
MGNDAPDPNAIEPPSPALQMLEGRIGAETLTLALRMPALLRSAPRGDGGHVLVLPGFMAGDASTSTLRGFLQAIGYRAQGWGQGQNRGRMLTYLPRVIELVEGYVANQGRPMPLVGWSRGGVLAREIARERPQLVTRVITLGSPVKGGVSATSIARFVESQTGLKPADLQRLQRERNVHPITRPITAVYSKTDGVVAWQACIDDMNPLVEHLEVRGSHVGLGFNADVFAIVAKELARR